MHDTIVQLSLLYHQEELQFQKSFPTFKLFCPAHIRFDIVAIFNKVDKLHMIVSGLLAVTVRGHCPEVNSRPIFTHKDIVDANALCRINYK